METSSDISVIIPYYNREQYIDETVQSVLAQTLKPLEIIIVNDCSRGDSRRYLDRYMGVCRIIDLPSNVGPSLARNEGIRNARGAFVAFLDDDDVWLPHKLEVQRKYLEQHPECAVVHSAAFSFSAGKPDVLWDCNWPPPLTLPQALNHDHWVILPTMLARIEVMQVLKGFDTRLWGSEDLDFQIRCSASGYRIENIREPLLRFRRERHESLTKRSWRIYWADVKVCWKHRALYYRVYGARGIVSFLLRRLHTASYYTRYVDGRVRFLMRVIGVKWQVRPGYRQ